MYGLIDGYFEANGSGVVQQEVNGIKNRGPKSLAKISIGLMSKLVKKSSYSFFPANLWLFNADFSVARKLSLVPYGRKWLYYIIGFPVLSLRQYTDRMLPI